MVRPRLLVSISLHLSERYSVLTYPELWQGAQVLPNISDTFREQSIGNTQSTPSIVTKQQNTPSEIRAVVKPSPAPSPAPLNHFVVSGNPPGSNGQATQSQVFILSQIAPNSQFNQTLFSSQIKEGPAYQLVESTNARRSTQSSIGVGYTSSQLQSITHNSPKQGLSTRSRMSDPHVGSSVNEQRPRSMPGPIHGSSVNEHQSPYHTIHSPNVGAHRMNYEASRKVDVDRSPSIIPEPLPSPEGVGDSRLVPQLPNIPLPPRTPQTDPYAPIRPSKLSSQTSTPYVPHPTQLNAPVLSEMEFIVPLPLPARVRDQYLRTIHHYQKPIERYLVATVPSQALVGEIETLITRLDRVATHIDLDNDTTISQQETSIEHETAWAISCSGKFQFLKALFEGIRHPSYHIAIVAQPGRLLNIIEKFLTGLNISHSTLDTPNGSTSQAPYGSLHVSILSSQNEQVGMVKPVHMIIAFDTSFSINNPQIQMLRTSTFNAQRFVPIVHPIVYCSTEHIRMALESAIPRDKQLKAMVNCIVEARFVVGELQPEEGRPHACAEEVAAFMDAGASSRHMWTIPEIRPIKVGIDLIESIQEDSSLDETRKRPGVSLYAVYSYSQLTLPQSAEGEAENSKRTKMSPAQDISHISDSTVQSQSAQITELQRALDHATSALQKASLKSHTKNAELESLLQSKDDALRAQMHALDDLQTRFEKRNRSYHRLKHEQKDLLEKADKSNARIASLEEAISKMKEEKKEIENELKEARDRLATSTEPGTVELENLREEVRTLKTSNENLENRLASLTTTFDYTRIQYQDASTIAADAVSKVSSLEEEVSSLRAIASGEISKANQLSSENAVATYVAALERANAQVEELKDQLKKREQKDRGRGMTTRQGSVAPRSPRVVEEGRSRQGSRAPGSRNVSPSRGVGMGRRGARGLVVVE